MYKSTYLFFSGAVLASALLQCTEVFAGNTTPSVRVNIANGQAIYSAGKGDATACAGCHGDKALGMDAMGAPRMANVGQMYILQQLDDYASGKRISPESGAVMNDIAKAMNEQDRRDVAAYLDSLDFEMEPSDLKALAADGVKIGNPKKGQIIMTKGIRHITPACQDCHGFSGRAQNIPAIHQQKYVYLVNQLKTYRDGSRANDKQVYKVGIMRGIAKKLSDDNIADIAAYLSTVTNFAP